ncbi:peptidoglycan DD-metalloendopeptidase family protein, partial [Promicromonospora citrea]|uniref:peptidoglycan DD-metalloendopeptidase family protein n=1 Tax=Promicromonospora citrea TaxID=43677 RepID=UPI0014884C16
MTTDTPTVGQADGPGRRSCVPGERARPVRPDRHAVRRRIARVVVTALLVGGWAPGPAAAVRSGPDVAVRRDAASTAERVWPSSGGTGGGARDEDRPSRSTSSGVVGDGGGAPQGTGPGSGLGYVAPVAGIDPPLGVERGFDPPEHEWGPGHRGVDLTAAVGAGVMAPGPGVVSFAGRVAGRGVVVVTHPDGLRSSLEPVTAGVPAGTAVVAGTVVGTVEGAGVAGRPAALRATAPRV